MSSNDYVFVIETCQNCKDHHWNTRHDEAKYNEFFQKVSSVILDHLPSAVVLRNQIPKAYLPFDLYCNLIPNDDDNATIYDQVPRTGSFEVSYKGLLIFSKLQHGYWPNVQLVGDKCFNIVRDEKDNKDLTPYLAGNSPSKIISTKKINDSRNMGSSRKMASRSPLRKSDASPNSSFKAQSKNDSQRILQASKQGSIVQAQQEEQQRLKRQEEEMKRRASEQNKIMSQKQAEAERKLQAEMEESRKKQEQDQQKLEQEQQRLMKIQQEQLQKQQEQEMMQRELEKERKKIQEEQQRIKLQQEQYQKEQEKLAQEQEKSIRDQEELLKKKLEQEQQQKKAKEEQEQQLNKAKEEQEQQLIKEREEQERQLKQQQEEQERKLKEQQEEQQRQLKQYEQEQEQLEQEQQKLAQKYVQELTQKSMEEEARKRIEEEEKKRNQEEAELRAQEIAIQKQKEQDRRQSLMDYKFQKKEVDETNSQQDQSKHKLVINQLENNPKFVDPEILSQQSAKVRESIDFNEKGSEKGSVRNIDKTSAKGSQKQLEKISERNSIKHQDSISQKKSVKDLDQQSEKYSDKFSETKGSAKGSQKQIDNASQKGSIKDMEMKSAKGSQKEKISQRGSIREQNKITEEISAKGSQKFISQKGSVKDMEIKSEKGSQKQNDIVSQKGSIKDMEIKSEIGSQKKIEKISEKGLIQDDIKSEKAYQTQQSKIQESGSIKDIDIKSEKVSQKQQEKLSEKGSIKDQKLVSEQVSIKKDQISEKGSIKDQKQISEKGSQKNIQEQKSVKEQQQDQTDGLKAKVVHLKFLEAELARDTEYLGKMDPYIKMTVNGLTYKTNVHKNSGKNPKWDDQEFDVLFNSGKDNVEIQIIEEDEKSNDKIGTVKIKIDDLIKDNGISEWFPIIYIGLEDGFLNIKSRHNPEEENITPNQYEIKQDELQSVAESEEQPMIDLKSHRLEIIDNKDQANTTKNAEVNSRMSRLSIGLQKSPWKHRVSILERPIKVGKDMFSHRDLKGMPMFPKGTKSLLSKYLTPEIWEKYKFEKDKFGFSFKQAIYLGCKNPKIIVGVFAGSQDTYYAFSDLFEKIIYDIQGHDIKNDVHNHNRDLSSFKFPQFSLEEQDLVLNTKIQTRRNLNDLPLLPMVGTKEISEEQYFDKENVYLENIIVSKLLQLKGELEGTYHKIDEISIEDKIILEKKEAYFKVDDEVLIDYGLHHNWPNGRGIFWNSDKSLVCIVNEEDQIRLVSSQKGCKIQQAFELMANASDELEKMIEFLQDEHLGYITSCPRQLGSALKIQITVKLTHLNKKFDELKKLCKDCGVEIIPHYEDDKKVQDVFVIYNKKTLGVSEMDIIKQISRGVKILVEREIKDIKKIYQRNSIDMNIKQQPNIKKAQTSIMTRQAELSTFPVFPIGSKSYLAKILNMEIWEDLKQKIIHQDAEISDLEQLLEPAKKFPDHTFGLFASSEKDYQQFDILIDEILDAAYSFEKDSKHVNNMQFTDLDPLKFDQEYEPFIVSSRVELVRNFKGYPLGTVISAEQREQIRDALLPVFKNFPENYSGRICNLNDISDEEYKAMSNYLFQQRRGIWAEAGFNRDWPAGRSLFITQDNMIGIQVNKEEHLRIVSKVQGSNLAQGYKNMAYLSVLIDHKLPYNKDEKYGYITSDLAEIGSGLKASIVIKLPKAFQKTEQFHKICFQNGTTFVELEKIKHIFEISVANKLGRSEWDTMMSLYNTVDAFLRVEIMMSDVEVDLQTANIKSYLDITGYPKFPEDSNHLIKKHLSKEQWSKLKNQHTVYDWKFKQLIAAGCKYYSMDKNLGIFAGGLSSYVMFKSFLQKVIHDHHRYKADDIHQNNFDVSNKIKGVNDIVLQSVKQINFKLSRNLDGLPLLTTVKKADKIVILRTLRDALCKIKDEKFEGKFHNLSRVPEADQQVLKADLTMCEKGGKMEEFVGLNEEWPYTRGIFFNEDKSFVAHINKADQLTLITRQKNGNFQNAYKNLADIYSQLQESVKFLKDKNLGFITVSPENIGSGLKIQVKFKIQMKRNKRLISDICQQFHVKILAINDYTLIMENIITFGKSEYEITNDMVRVLKVVLAGHFQKKEAPANEEQKQA